MIDRVIGQNASPPASGATKLFTQLTEESKEQSQTISSENKALDPAKPSHRAVEDEENYSDDFE